MLVDEMLSYFTTAHSTKNPLDMKLFHDKNKFYGTLMSRKFREGLDQSLDFLKSHTYTDQNDNLNKIRQSH